MATFAVILAAAGSSTRFGDPHKKKPFVNLKGRAIWLRAMEPLQAHPDVKQSIIVVSPDDMEWFKEKYRPNLAFMDIEVVAGGKERADSVQNALKQVREEIDFVAVHDAARPLVTNKEISAVFEAATQYGGAIPACPIASTIKRVEGETISETVPRDGLWAAQTPQVFGRQLLIDSYAQRGDFTPTDEAQLVEKAGTKVAVVKTSAMNIKITTQDDLRMAEALLHLVEKSHESRPLHPFADEKPDLFS